MHRVSHLVITAFASATFVGTVSYSQAPTAAAGEVKTDQTMGRLVLARQVVVMLNLKDSLTKMSKALSEPAARQFGAQVAALPEAKKRAAIEAFSLAASQAESSHVQRELEHAAETYASNMTTDQLEKLVALYATPLGQKMVLSAQSLTLAERQEAGAYTLAHPGTLEAITAMFSSSAKTRGPWQASEQRVFQATFHAGLCARLNAIQIKYSTCSASAATSASQ